MKPHVCPLCHGEGEVVATGVDGSTVEVKTRPCPPCKGTGIVWGMEPVYIPSVWVDEPPDSATDRVITYSDHTEEDS